MPKGETGLKQGLSSTKDARKAPKGTVGSGKEGLPEANRKRKATHGGNKTHLC